MAEFVAGSLNSVFSFALALKTRFDFDVPLGSTVAFTASPTSSVITGMRRAKAGVSPPRETPCTKYDMIYTRYFAPGIMFTWLSCVDPPDNFDRIVNGLTLRIISRAAKGVINPHVP